MPTAATAAPRPSNRVANIRGAVPAPKENPCMPCRSPHAHSAKIATAHSTRPPTKSCGHLTQPGMMDLTALALGVSLIENLPPVAWSNYGGLPGLPPILQLSAP